MSDRLQRPVLSLALLLAVCVVLPTTVLAQVDSDPIRLGRPSAEESRETEPEAGESLGQARRAFDYDAFESRLQTLWFQRKALLVEGRYADASRQAGLIRDFCAEEGVGRLQGLADALLVEADRFLDEGNYDQALSALELADHLDPGRSQIRFARAAVSWESDSGLLSTAADLLNGLGASFQEGFRDFSLVNQLILIAVLAVLGCTALFSILMMARYQLPFRHEIEEFCLRRGKGEWGPVLGWFLLLLPLVIWAGAGWVVMYWFVTCFRFFRRKEKLVTVALLLATILAIPAGRVAVAVYGMTTDPVVRTTLEASRGLYSPERVVKLQKLVSTYPDDAIYRFLLAGLYKNGRFFEEAFGEYKQALALEPSLYQAYINIGNIFYLTGQHGESVVQYRKALDLKPDSVLAFFNMHLAQAESFRFTESEESLDRASALNQKRVTELIAQEGREGDRIVVVDAAVRLGSIWQVALEGGRLQQQVRSENAISAADTLPRQFLNPVSIMAAITVLACGIMLALSAGKRPPAERCVRCGRPFCHRCKSGREGHDYCSHCMHLFVLGDGLAPETKTRKLYEVERHEKRTRLSRKLLGLVLPGASQLLRGRAGLALVLLLLWFTALIAWKPVLMRPVEFLLGLDLRLDLLAAGMVPSSFHANAWSILGLSVAVITWIIANAGSLRRTGT